MPKLKRLFGEESPLQKRDEIMFSYRNKYFNLFLSNYLIEGDMDYQQKHYFLKKMWSVGKLACFKQEFTEGSTKHPNGNLVFCEFASTELNLYDFPVKVSLINTRGVKFIPSTPQMVDEDVVIGYAQPNHKSIAEMVEFYIKKIANIEMVIGTNTISLKTPWLWAVSPENETKLKKLLSDLLSDEPVLFASIEDLQNAKALISGSPYIIDKLYNQKCAYENELREFLGFNNLGVNEKKEHLVTTEVEMNNDITQCSGDCFLDSMADFFDRISNILGVMLTIKSKQQIQEEKKQKEMKEMMDKNPQGDEEDENE